MTQRSRAGFTSEIGSELANNTSRAISPQDVRDNMQDLADSVPWYDEVLYPDATANLEVGYTTDLYAFGEVTSGTATIDLTNEAIQTLTNGGAFTLAPPSSGNGQVLLEITNNSSAGAITTSGFTAVDGDSFDTVDGNHFLCSVTKIGSRTYLTVIAAADNS